MFSRLCVGRREGREQFRKGGRNLQLVLTLLDQCRDTVSWTHVPVTDKVELVAFLCFCLNLPSCKMGIQLNRLREGVVIKMFTHSFVKHFQTS